MDINESPVYVLLNPSINHSQRDLPVTIYESGMYLLLSDSIKKERGSIAFSVFLLVFGFSFVPFIFFGCDYCSEERNCVLLLNDACLMLLQLQNCMS